MMYSTDLAIRRDDTVLSLFSRKKRQALDKQRAEEAEQMVASTVKELDKATLAVKKVNQKAVSQVGVYDIAERLYYATRRKKDV